MAEITEVAEVIPQVRAFPKKLSQNNSSKRNKGKATIVKNFSKIARPQRFKGVF